MDSFLMHYGIPGMKWGVRRFQMKGSSKRTEAGKKRYNSARRKSKDKEEVLFVSGSSKTQDQESGYMRKKLPAPIRKELKNAKRNGDRIVVGDAPGIDRQVQNYIKDYDNVTVYGPGTHVRYKANKNWESKAIDAPEFEEGSGEWLAKKDIAMAKAATRGLAVVLDNGAKATRNNVKRLKKQHKEVKVYELSKSGKQKDHWW